MSNLRICIMALTAPLLFAGAASAATTAAPVAKATVAAKTAEAKAETAKVAAASAKKSAAKAAKAKTLASKSEAKAGGHMVQTKLANGKTVTYNCSLAGNKTKTACKG